MPSLFADTHNVIVILEKSNASEGFAQIIDFLSGSYINYALTASPPIYISYIKQFWNTAVVKRTDDVTRVGKGCSGVKTPLFDNMLHVREEDAEEEVQVPTHDDADQENIIEETADDVPQPTSPLPSSPIKVGTSQRIESSEDEENVFNQGRKSVDIDEGIKIVDDQQKDVQVKGRQADTQANIYNIDLDHTSKVLSIQEDSEVQEVVEVVNAAKLITEVVTAATTQVIPAAELVVAVVSTPISAAKPKGLKVVPAAPTVSTRKRKRVVIRDPEEELHDDTPTETQSAKDKGKGIFVEDPKPIKKKDQIAMDAEYARKLQEEEESLAQAKDAQTTDVQPKDAPEKGIQYIRRYHGYKKKPQSESQARKNMIDYLKNTEGFKMAFFKGKLMIKLDQFSKLGLMPT
nr:hypothetical protein [Tanacetum cinerariifolium]